MIIRFLATGCIVILLTEMGKICESSGMLVNVNNKLSERKIPDLRLTSICKYCHHGLIHSTDMTSVSERWFHIGFQDLGELSSSASSSVTSSEEGIKSRILLWSGLKLKTLLDTEQSRNQLH